MTQSSLFEITKADRGQGRQKDPERSPVRTDEAGASGGASDTAALFESARRAMLVGIKRAGAAADRAWLDQAAEALIRCALDKSSFISDDVWHYGLESTREDRALGIVFKRAALAGLITKTDRVRPSVRSHLAGKPVWVSNIFGRAA